MDGVGERHTATPAESDDSVFLLRCRESHTVLSDRVELFLDPCGIERPYGVRRHPRDHTIGPARQILHGQQIGSERDESIRRQLVRDASHPGRKTKNFVDDDHNRRFGAPLRVDDPGANAVPSAGFDHSPLTMARGRRQPRGGTSRISRYRARLLGDGCGCCRCDVIRVGVR